MVTDPSIQSNYYNIATTVGFNTKRLTYRIYVTLCVTVMLAKLDLEKGEKALKRAPGRNNAGT